MGGPLTPVRVGVVGCGVISGAYLANLPRFPILEVAACADLDPARAAQAAAAHGVPRACTVDELLADPAIELVLNLTVPQAHVEIGLRALRAGKHVYSEKPFALDRAGADAVLGLAAERGLRVGCAPDTPLSGSVQTARALIDAGAIGRPIAAHAYLMSGGHESWHPNPDFYYRAGGGPLLDLGPYHLHALVTLLGPVARVAGLARRTWPERVIGSAPRRGELIPVEVSTHLACLLDFASGVAVTLVASFDIRTGYTAPCIEILGERGSLALPHDASRPVRLSLPEDAGGWREMPFTHPYRPDLRGVGVADLAMAVRTGRAHRADGAFARHILEVMLAVEESSADGRFVDLAPGFERPAPMAIRPEYDLDP